MDVMPFSTFLIPSSRRVCMPSFRACSRISSADALSRISWVSSGGYNPAVAMVYALTEPLLRPFRRIIPPIGGFDISAIFALIALGALVRLFMGLL